MISKFDAIRPYDDTDLPRILTKLFNNKEFIRTIVAFKFSAWPKFTWPLLGFITRHYIISQISGIKNLTGFRRLVEPYVQRMIDTTTQAFTVSGLDKLDLSQACLFVSNHRDIALDPALVNWVLHINQQDTVRIAVGDNLLKKEWVADLIRLNKCFIVKRSAPDRREKLAAAKLLSEYIFHTLQTDKQHIWIAQREGRAKDGNDITNPAIISMLTINKPKEIEFADYVRQLRIVPVSISYEFDPCDISKAKELHQVDLLGAYDKPDNEDMRSIVNGITGKKGRVHVHFGQVANESFDSAKQVAEYLDKEILAGYQTFSSGKAALQLLEQLTDKNQNTSPTNSTMEMKAAIAYLQSRMVQLNEAEQKKLLTMYANAYIKQRDRTQQNG
ncbi:1-acyl-sn-glycerol-3-phosphate acyltransferase [Paraglaciecola hydrolytica]|uniref:Cytochrome C oxidase Cbb3 n=1 Tax=Paraglaciecola hydrolytica TaxID=1799789 RepID=A0A136A590_9ALTE|nr:1-acyl-sn-glycerol-3-phosphate acyltransferase [Paraglaciecola hydrolytica]KXI30405.1 cytochrome C oxidase Cbb3 [Paraglaciecola hydrolytica]